MSSELAAGLPPCTRLGHREEPSHPSILVHHSKPTDARRLGVHTAKGEWHHSAQHPATPPKANHADKSEEETHNTHSNTTLHT